MNGHLYNIKNKIHFLINKGQSRSVLAKKNVIASLIIKIFDLGLSLLLVPLVLDYLDQTRYGIWLTITSIVAWFTYLDIGLGNGLRNKFAEAKASGKHQLARYYLSTTYAILAIIMGSFFTIFLIGNFFLPWAKILNVDPKLGFDLSSLALIVFGFFSLNFIVKLINTIVVADQRPAIRDGIALLGKISIVITIYILTKTTSGSLIYLGLAYSGLPVLVMIIVSFYYFKHEYKKYRPSIHFVDFKYTKDLMGLGWKFFVIQIALVIIMSTDNIIITQLFEPRLVTPYQIANKYFYLILSLFSLIITPLWSATSEALVLKDFGWIKSSVRKIYRIAFVFILLFLIMFAISKQMYSFWVGEKIHISYLLSFFWMLFGIIGMFNGIYHSVINGSGYTKLQMGTYILSMLINIPLSIFFASYLRLGIEGVILATIICQSLHFIYAPVQYKKIVSNNASGIWAE